MAAHVHHLAPRHRRPRRQQERTDPLEGREEEDIIARYRLRPATIRFVANLLAPFLQRMTERSKALSALLQVMIALRFYATGAYQSVVADSLVMAKSTVSRTVTEVTMALCRHAAAYIRFPGGVYGLRDVKEQFYNMHGKSHSFY